MVELPESVLEHIEDVKGWFKELGFDPQKAGYEQLSAEGIAAMPDELDYETETPELDCVMRVENKIIGMYVDKRVELIEAKREKAKGSTFATVTQHDNIAECCYKRSIRVLFAAPEKPNRIIFDRYERKPDAVDIFVELDKFMRGAPGFEDLSRAVEYRCWPIIKACLDSLGFRPAWGQNPQAPWEGGGRSAAESATTAKQRAAGGMKA